MWKEGRKEGDMTVGGKRLAKPLFGWKRLN